MRAELSKQSLDAIKERLRPTAEKMDKVAGKGRDQVHARYDSAGASGNVTWPPGKGKDADKTPLSGLRNTWVIESKEGEASTYSTKFVNGWNLALIHNYGTKDGSIPARPQIPDSIQERADMGVFVIKTIAEK